MKPAALLTIPGNHDIPLFNLALRAFAPYANYSRAFGENLEPEFESAHLLVIGVNTTRPRRHKDGELSVEQIDRVTQRLQRAAASQLRIIVVHQPVLAIRKSDEDNLLDGHQQAVPAWAAAGGDIIMGGHIHLPYVRSLRTTFGDSAARHMDRAGGHRGFFAHPRRHHQFGEPDPLRRRPIAAPMRS